MKSLSLLTLATLNRNSVIAPLLPHMVALIRRPPLASFRAMFPLSWLRQAVREKIFHKLTFGNLGAYNINIIRPCLRSDKFANRAGSFPPSLWRFIQTSTLPRILAAFGGCSVVLNPLIYLDS